MNVQTSVTQASVRDLELGIGQSKRAKHTAAYAGTLLPVFRQMLISLVPPDESRSEEETKELLEQAAQLVADLLVTAANHNIDIQLPKTLFSHELMKEFWTKERTALAHILPVFKRPDLAVGASLDEDLEVMGEALVALAAEMVNSGLLGFLLYRQGNSAAYSYVIREVTVVIEDERKSTTRTGFDASAPMGQRNTYKTKIDFSGQAKHAVVEHVHHCEQVSEVPLVSYQAKVPPRVASFKSLIPKTLRPYVRVMFGDIIREESHQLAAYETEWKSQVVRVHKFSPCLLLGDLVLTGWSSDDFPRANLGGQALTAALVGGAVLGTLAILFPGAALGVATRVAGVALGASRAVI